MATISGAEYDEQASTPTTPASGTWKLYPKADGFYALDDTGAEIGPLGAGTAAFSGAKSVKTTAQSLTANTVTAITFTDGEVFDTDTYHDTATNPSRFTVPSTGKYQVIGYVLYATASTGDRLVGFRVNGLGNENQDSRLPSADRQTAITLSDVLSLTAGDYVELTARQRTSGALNVDAASFSIQKVD